MINIVKKIKPKVFLQYLTKEEVLMKCRKWIITKPSRGQYTPDCLELKELEVPTVGEGQILIKTHLLSIDPTTRNWLKLDPKKIPFKLTVGDVMVGQNVGEVIESKNSDFKPGDIVRGLWGWEEYAIITPQGLDNHGSESDIPKDLFLSIFSHIGLAVMTGLYGVGNIKSEDVVVVSGAAGATGSIAVQVAKAVGCRVIGIDSGVKQLEYLHEIGADEVIDYVSEDLNVALQKHCPNGINLYFDNVGGKALDAILLNMAMDCRIAVCGMISQYNTSSISEQEGVKNLQMLIFHRARMQGFLAGQFTDRNQEFTDKLYKLWKSGKIIQRSNIVDGFENMADAVNINFQSGGKGKLMIRV